MHCTLLTNIHNTHTHSVVPRVDQFKCDLYLCHSLCRPPYITPSSSCRPFVCGRRGRRTKYFKIHFYKILHIYKKKLLQMKDIK